MLKEKQEAYTIQKEIMRKKAEANNDVPDDMVFDPVVLDTAEKIRIDRMESYKRIVLKVTTPNDWLNINDKAYAGGGACEKLARCFDMSWVIKDGYPKREDHKDDLGPYYYYVCQGTMYMGKDRSISLEEEGMCSSRDNAIGTNFDKKLLHMVDEINIRKAAITNFIVRGVHAMIGLENITWTDLASVGIAKHLVKAMVFGMPYKKVPLSQPVHIDTKTVLKYAKGFSAPVGIELTKIEGIASNVKHTLFNTGKGVTQFDVWDEVAHTSYFCKSWDEDKGPIKVNTGDYVRIKDARRSEYKGKIEWVVRHIIVDNNKLNAQENLDW